VPGAAEWEARPSRAEYGCVEEVYIRFSGCGLIARSLTMKINGLCGMAQ
jgi:hypothetical protein